jgi:hypothetical protein
MFAMKEELKSCRPIIGLQERNKTTIPENYLDKEYQAPAFSVNLNKSNSLRLFFMPLIVYICLQFILNGADKIR